MSVSILDGQLTRTWKYELEGKQHVMTLYHDTITGVRSMMLNYEEVPGSMGNSSLIMDGGGHVIPYKINEAWSGYIEISRSGFFGFTYDCFLNGMKLKEVTSELKNVDKDIFKASVVETINAPDEEYNGAMVAWYVVEVTRLEDNLATQVHRRFRDFADMNSQIKQNLKGHHLLGSLPGLPEKTLKILVDHSDPAFVQDRIDGLNHYLRMMINLPHVSDMTCLRGFLGIMDKVVEYSTVFHTGTLGLTLDAPSLVGSVQEPELCPGVRAGDSISKVNGVPVAGLNFNGVVARLKFLPRPLIVHFVGYLTSDGKRKESNTATYRGEPSPLSTSASGGASGGASNATAAVRDPAPAPVAHTPVVQAPAPAPAVQATQPLIPNRVSTFVSPDKLAAFDDSFDDISISDTPVPFTQGPLSTSTPAAVTATSATTTTTTTKASNATISAANASSTSVVKSASLVVEPKIEDKSDVKPDMKPGGNALDEIDMLFAEGIAEVHANGNTTASSEERGGERTAVSDGGGGPSATTATTIATGDMQFLEDESI